jgi:hypothetical protein
MAKVKITNRVFRLKHKKAIEAPNGDMLSFKAGEEFHIVADVLYMSGYLVPAGLQTFLINWIMNNKFLFVEDTRIF